MFFAHIENKTDGCFTFGTKVAAIAHPCLCNDAIRSFWKGFCCQASELDITTTEDYVFTVGTAERPTLDGKEYAICMEKTGICIVGTDKKSLIHGYMTLLHRIEVLSITDTDALFSLPCGTLRESPRLANQMVHFCIFPETELWELERFIRFSAALKYTHIVLEFWGMLRYDCLKELSWPQAFSKAQVRPLIHMANDLGLEVIPMFNHLGHAASSRVCYGKHVVLDQNPRLQPLFSEDGWSWRVDKPEVLELLRKVRTELLELCGEGKYFHLGCDEIYNWDITTENYTIVTDYLNAISDELTAQGRRAIIWGDMFLNKHENYNPNNRYVAFCKDVETEQAMQAALSRDIVIADWQYNVKEAPVETALLFQKSGFDTLLCPWDRAFRDRSIEPCLETAAEHNLFGLMHTTWNTLCKGMRDVARAAYYAWYPGKPEMPSDAFVTTYTAKILRNVYPVHGDYEKAGWAKQQITILE